MRLDVFCNSEYCDNRPFGAKINITKELLEHIIKLSEIIKKADAVYIAAFDNSPDWLTSKEDNDEWEGNLETGMMIVWRDTVTWNACVKHSGEQIETEAIYIKELKEIYQALTTPKEDLPLLIGLKSEEAKNIIEKRLKENG